MAEAVGIALFVIPALTMTVRGGFDAAQARCDLNRAVTSYQDAARNFQETSEKEFNYYQTISDELVQKLNDLYLGMARAAAQLKLAQSTFQKQYQQLQITVVVIVVVVGLLLLAKKLNVLTLDPFAST